MEGKGRQNQRRGIIGSLVDGARLLAFASSFVMLAACGGATESTNVTPVEQTSVPTSTPMVTANLMPTSTPIPISTAVPTSTPVPSNTPIPTEQINKMNAKDKIEQIIRSRTTEFVDISEFLLTPVEFGDIYRDLIDGECADVVAVYETYLPTSVRGNGIVKKFYVKYTLVGTLDDAQAAIDDATKMALAGVSSEMSDLEKVLVLHDYVVDTVSYSMQGNSIATAWGGLVDHKVLCEGYASTLIYLLNCVGIEAKRSAGDNHAWVLACIDGEWYLIDPTWDDTRDNGKHYYLIRSEEEFVNKLSGKHVYGTNFSGSMRWVDTVYAATSEKYNNWFVHDVKGNIKYYGGYWYFSDGKNVCKCLIDGTHKDVVYHSDVNIEVLRVEGDFLVIKENGKEKKVGLK